MIVLIQCATSIHAREGLYAIKKHTISREEKEIKMKKILFVVGGLFILFCFSQATVGQVHAMAFSPGVSYQLAIGSGNVNDMPDIQKEIYNYDPFLILDESLYKNEHDEDDHEKSIVSGVLSNSFTTTYLADADDPSGATIEIEPGASVSGYLFDYLFVKDGKHYPVWYLFDLSGWDRSENLELRDFWPNSGAISHVALYGQPVPVPLPPAVLMFGAGLMGLGGLRFRKKRK